MAKEFISETPGDISSRIQAHLTSFLTVVCYWNAVFSKFHNSEILAQLPLLAILEVISPVGPLCMSPLQLDDISIEVLSNFIIERDSEPSHPRGFSLFITYPVQAPFSSFGIINSSCKLYA